MTTTTAIAFDVISSHSTEELATKRAAKVGGEVAFFAVDRFSVPAWHVFVRVADFTAPMTKGAKCRQRVTFLPA